MAKQSSVTILERDYDKSVHNIIMKEMMFNMLNYTNDMKKLDEELRHFHYNENGKFKGAQGIENIMLKI